MTVRKWLKCVGFQNFTDINLQLFGGERLFLLISCRNLEKIVAIKWFTLFIYIHRARVLIIFIYYIYILFSDAEKQRNYVGFWGALTTFWLFFYASLQLFGCKNPLTYNFLAVNKCFKNRLKCG